MRYIAAYLLLQIGGNADPSVSDIKKVLDSVGIETDEERAEKLVSELQGKDISSVIAEGNSKLASVPSGGAAAAGGGGGAPAAGGGGAAAPAAEEKEKEEEKEESDEDMGFGLFD